MQRDAAFKRFEAIMDNITKLLSPEDEKIDTDGMRRILGRPDRPADRSTVWRAVKRGYIPKPRYLTPGSPYWLRSEMLELIKARTPGAVPAPQAA